MTTEQKIGAIKLACARAQYPTADQEIWDALARHNVFRLADVLLAVGPWIGESPDEGKMINEKICQLLSILQMWDYKNDSLSDQSPETIDFILATLTQDQ